ncbi:MAG: penicillin-binding protein activator, partial [Gammaproteobacteria bacterium]|nr:penicillin-binding protein activator [Gammaproteobacteria bacterium]
GNQVPTLALNFAESDTSTLSGFYQFALWPEDEAQAVARRAYASGARTAVALVPSTETGYRLLNSFRAAFEELGGEFLGFNGYDPNAQDFSGPIETLLNLDRSQQRRTRLAANLNVGITFEPRRRQDVDMIFLGADRATARLLAPALNFHFAGDIPTYATSDIHQPGAARDSDLNDIFFPDAPLLLSPDPEAAQLRSALERYWPQRAPFLRLYGMGVDAYELAGSLFSGSGQWPIDGVSGLLELDVAGRVHRVLPFAQFRNGQPVALEPLSDPRPERRGVLEAEELVGAR